MKFLHGSDMDENTLETLERLFLSLSDKTRLRLVMLMRSGEVSVGYIADALGQSQPKISRHLAYLRNAGLVSTRRDGKWIYYAIEPPQNAAANRVLMEILGSHGGEQPIAVATASSGYSDMQQHFFETEYVPQEIEVYLL